MTLYFFLSILTTMFRDTILYSFFFFTRQGRLSKVNPVRTIDDDRDQLLNLDAHPPHGNCFTTLIFNVCTLHYGCPVDAPGHYTAATTSTRQ